MLYQGQLRDSTGAPLTGVYNITFTVYNDSVAGTSLYSTTDIVQLDDRGVFSVELGPFAENVFTGEKRFLGIQIGNDEELSPRQPLTAAPYAFQAASSPHISARLKKNITPLGLETKIIDSVIVECTAPGIIYILAEGTFTQTHQSGDGNQSARVFISRSDLESGNFLRTMNSIPSDAASGKYTSPWTVIETDRVLDAGKYIYYLKGETGSGENSHPPQDAVDYCRMVATFYPANTEQ